MTKLEKKKKYLLNLLQINYETEKITWYYYYNFPKFSIQIFFLKNILEKSHCVFLSEQFF